MQRVKETLCVTLLSLTSTKNEPPKDDSAYITGNVPINRRTLKLDPDTAPREEFLGLRARWDRLHTARNPFP